ncbi:major capsid protein [Microviridae sp.]|nr:major capsid protein [Microviridae sp.]
MKRAKHTLSHYRMVTANMGELFPISCVPVLPGDTMQGNTSALVRVSPLNTPVMHPVKVRLHTFFVPNRVVWPETEVGGGWESFITGGADGTATPTIPTSNTNTTKKTVATYLGLPPIGGVAYNQLPLRAVNAIYNDYYRDQDLCPERVFNDNTVPKIAWEKDYFSSARPFSQKGPDVTVPLGTRAPVASDQTAGNPLAIYSTDSADYEAMPSDGVTLQMGGAGGTEANSMYADLTNATAANVNDWRAAFSIQRYQEARARYGSRFTEYLRYLGITPSDARLQRPEFISGGTTRLNFSEVLQTSPNSEADADGVGDLYGHGIAGARTNKWRRFFEEHGYVITMMSIRPKALYLNGVQRDFLKTTKEDYYQKELVNLGQQEVYQAELYAENERDVFGYQDRYHEYRSHPSQISQDFRDTLNAWHLGRDLQANVTLNQSFVECNPSKRIFQVDDGSVDSLWIMANNHLVARRLVPKRANPRIL